MGTKVFIREKGKGDFISREIAYIKEVSEKDTQRLAEVTEEVIQETIRSKVKRQGSTDKLASSFKAGPIENGWGVGDISYLNANVKYWNHQDKGSEALGANWQHILPKGKWVNQRWVVDSDGYWLMPSKPIPAMNYIAETIAQLNTIIHRVLSEKRK